MSYATQSLGVVNNVLKLHNLLLYMDRKIEYFKVMFCRVCGFRVRVWKCYRTSRSFRYGYESVTELPEVPGIVALACRTHRRAGAKGAVPIPRVLWHGVYRTHRSSGTGTKVLQNLQKSGIVARVYRTYKSSGYG